MYKKITARLGVEPRTFRLTAECSNQLSYQANFLQNRNRTSDLRRID